MSQSPAGNHPRGPKTLTSQLRRWGFLEAFLAMIMIVSLTCWDFVKTWWKDALKWCGIVVGSILCFFAGMIIACILMWTLALAVGYVLSSLFGKAFTG